MTKIDFFTDLPLAYIWPCSLSMTVPVGRYSLQYTSSKSNITIWPLRVKDSNFRFTEIFRQKVVQPDRQPRRISKHKFSCIIMRTQILPPASSACRNQRLKNSFERWVGLRQTSVEWATFHNISFLAHGLNVGWVHSNFQIHVNLNNTFWYSCTKRPPKPFWRHCWEYFTDSARK